MSRQARLDAPGTLHHTMLRGIEKRQIDVEKGRQGSVKYLGDLAEKAEARIYAGLSMTDPAHLLFRRKQEVIQLSQQPPVPRDFPKYKKVFPSLPSFS